MTRDGEPRGQVDHLMVDGGLVLATGWIELDEAAPLHARLFADERELPLERAQVVRMTRDDVHEQARWGFVLFGELDVDPDATGLSLDIGSDAGRARLPCPAPGDLRGLLETIAAATPEEREHIRALVEERMGRFAHGSADLPHPNQLHPRLRAHVDRACLVPGEGVFVYGWILDPTSQLRAVHWVGPRGTGPNLLDNGVRHPRADVVKAHPNLEPGPVPAGISGLVRLDADDIPASGELLFVTRSGAAGMLSFPVEDPSGGVAPQLGIILASFRPDAPDAARVLDTHVGPAIEARWKARHPETEEIREHAFGTPPSDPVCTIVVPLFGRYDFLLYQLSQFARDPELSNVDLIYVIDDPRIRDATIRLAREVAPLWPVPFRVLDLGRNLGYAGANNAGARAGRGEYLLLLNSDVMPDRPGWVGRLIAEHRSLPHCGALAPRLLFEDGSIQHDGIGFVPHPQLPKIWLNDHPGKGLPPDLAPPPEAAEVPAVTGACMLLRRDTYLELGGLDEEYVVGDFEDSDLCLRLRERGELSYCVRGETLFHLERQSLPHLGPVGWRAKITLYNAWRHTRKWNEVLTELAEKSAGGGASG